MAQWLRIQLQALGKKKKKDDRTLHLWFQVNIYIYSGVHGISITNPIQYNLFIYSVEKNSESFFHKIHRLLLLEWSHLK